MLVSNIFRFFGAAFLFNCLFFSASSVFAQTNGSGTPISEKETRLVSHLITNPSPGIRQQGLIFCRTLHPDYRVVGPIIRTMVSNDSEDYVRFEAYITLAHIGLMDNEKIDALADLTEPGVESYISAGVILVARSYACCKMGLEESVWLPDMITAIKGDDYELQIEALRLISDIGPAATGLVKDIQALVDPYGNGIYARAALYNIGSDPETNLEELVKVALSKNGDPAQDPAIMSLGLCGANPLVLDTLKTLLSDNSYFLTGFFSNAITSLGENANELMPYIENRIGEIPGHTMFDYSGAMLLIALGETAIPRLIELSDSDNLSIQADAHYCLSAYGIDTIAHIQSLIKMPRIYEHWAVQTPELIAAIGTEAYPFLIEAIEKGDDTGFTSLLVYYSVEDLPLEVFSTLSMVAFTNDNPYWRQAVAIILGMHKDNSMAREILNAMANDDSPMVRSEVINAIGTAVGL